MALVKFDKGLILKLPINTKDCVGFMEKVYKKVYN